MNPTSVANRTLPQPSYRSSDVLNGVCEESPLWKTRPLDRRGFLALGITASALGLLPACRSARTSRGPGSRLGRLFFTSQGRTGVINADGTGLRYFDFKVPEQVTWQPGPFLSDGRRVIFLSMEERRDGPGRPFDKFYHQTPTHLWLYDLDRDTLTEIATKDRIAVFYTPALLVSDERILVQVVRDQGGQIFSMNLDGTDAREFTRLGEGLPYGLSLSPDRTSGGVSPRQSGGLPNLDEQCRWDGSRSRCCASRSTLLRAELVAGRSVAVVSGLPVQVRSGARLERRLHRAPGWKRLSRADERAGDVVRGDVRKPIRIAAVDRIFRPGRPMARSSSRDVLPAPKCRGSFRRIGPTRITSIAISNQTRRAAACRFAGWTRAKDRRRR